DWRPVAGPAFHAFEIESRRQGVHGLADECAATVEAPEAVSLAVRTGVGFLAMHPQHLCTGLLDDLPLLLNCRRIDPVFSVEDHRPGLRFGLEHPIDAGQCTIESPAH